VIQEFTFIKTDTSGLDHEAVHSVTCHRVDTQKIQDGFSTFLSREN